MGVLYEIEEVWRIGVKKRIRGKEVVRGRCCIGCEKRKWCWGAKKRDRTWEMRKRTSEREGQSGND